MTYNLATVRDRVVNDKLDDVTYDPSIVNNFVNDAQRSIFNNYELPFMEKVFVGTLAPSEYIYIYPTDFQMAQSMVLRTPTLQSVDLTDLYIPFRDFNARYPAPSLSIAGQPRAWTTYGNKLYFGQPTDGTYTLSLFYLKKPATLDDDADVPEIPEEFQEALVLGAYYRVLQRNEDYDLAASIEVEYEKEMLKMVKRLGPRQKTTTHVMAQPLRNLARRTI